MNFFVKLRCTVEMTILDVGMVINLNEGRKDFGDFKISSERESKGGARIIY